MSNSSPITAARKIASIGIIAAVLLLTASPFVAATRHGLGLNSTIETLKAEVARMEDRLAAERTQSAERLAAFGAELQDLPVLSDAAAAAALVEAACARAVAAAAQCESRITDLSPAVADYSATARWRGRTETLPTLLAAVAAPPLRIRSLTVSAAGGGEVSVVADFGAPGAAAPKEESS
jgi:hypothetical protein